MQSQLDNELQVKVTQSLRHDTQLLGLTAMLMDINNYAVDMDNGSDDVVFNFMLQNNNSKDHQNWPRKFNIYTKCKCKGMNERQIVKQVESLDFGMEIVRELKRLSTVDHSDTRKEVRDFLGGFTSWNKKRVIQLHKERSND